MITGCASLETPNGEVGKEWCYIDKSEPETSKVWDYCFDEIDYDSLR